VAAAPRLRPGADLSAWSAVTTTPFIANLPQERPRTRPIPARLSRDGRYFPGRVIKNAIGVPIGQGCTGIPAAKDYGDLGAAMLSNLGLGTKLYMGFGIILALMCSPASSP
jgi:hypothetical protein